MKTRYQPKSDSNRSDEFVTVRVPRDNALSGVMPPNFEVDYVAGAVVPFLLNDQYAGDTPLLPMIDIAFSKENAGPVHIWGMLYDKWAPNPEEGVGVSFQGYENRGLNNERKRIYMSATTPDLIVTKYRSKITSFFEKFFADANTGKPLMRRYCEYYHDLYWDLHLGVSGDAIPVEVRQIGASFNTVLGYWYPTLEVVHENYMRVRELRPFVMSWIDARVQDIVNGKTPNRDRTFVYYWLKNGGQGENFRRKDIIFECFRNLLALSQWGSTTYNVMARLEATHGDPKVKAWFERTMKNQPEETDVGAFTPLDRFVMELFRTITPNTSSLSTLKRQRHLLDPQFSTISTGHENANMDPRHWNKPEEFDPDRYKTVPTSADNDATKCKQVSLAQCPFPKTSFPVKDGRKAELTNSTFGAVYSVINDRSYPVADTAGYAFFGFGYRRCPGEHLTLEFFKE